MARFLHRFFVGLLRNANTMLVAVCFVAGFYSGIRLSYEAEITFSWMRGALDGTVSIAGLLSVLLLPFLFSALAVYFSKPCLLYGLAFLKAFVFAVVSAGICFGYGSAGWLVRWLLMFSDHLSLPLLMLYWLRHIPGKRVFQITDTAIFAGCLVLIGIVDHMLILPLVREILT